MHTINNDYTASPQPGRSNKVDSMATENRDKRNKSTIPVRSGGGQQKDQSYFQELLKKKYDNNKSNNSSNPMGLVMGPP